MTFAIDFDGTFARDPEFFKKFVELAKLNGHECVLVTGRSRDHYLSKQVFDLVGDVFVAVVFAGAMWKRDAAKKAGWNVDIWIDDNPEYIGKQINYRR